MRLHKNLSPLKLQKLLFKAMLPNFLVTFVVLGAVLLGLSVYAGVFSLTIQYLVIFFPALLFIAAFLSVVRFYKYIFVNLRVLNAFSSFYKSFGRGKSSLTAAFPEPFFFWKGLLEGAETTDEDKFFYLMETDSDRYNVHVKCVVEGKDYKLWALVKDWRGARHVKRTEGNYAKVSSEVFGVINPIHDEVVKAVPSHGEVPKEFGLKPKVPMETEEVAPAALEKRKGEEKVSEIPEAQELRKRLKAKKKSKPPEKETKKVEEKKELKRRQKKTKPLKKKKEIKKKESEEKEAEEALDAFDDVLEDLENV